ncbi:mediator of RNA polymerase II transcription subunit 8 [Teratosphaeriaceae sp. CCFEE 6253]|nr:mediator of RNA polymerase II transcription subunit 8 [Teratosphaeriaceae sp. CCFEE 6253]
MSISKEQTRTLDRLREQLVIAVRALGTSKQNLLKADQLPTWEDLQGDHRFIVQRIVAVQATLDEHRDFLTSLHAYPLPSYPGHTHEGLLQNLLRKRLDIAPEGWVAKYSKPRAKQDADGDEVIGGLDDGDYLDLWSSAAATSKTFWSKELRESQEWDDDYTIAEREAGIEGVKTGLKLARDSGIQPDGSGEEDDDGDEDEKMEDAMPSQRAHATPEPGIDTSLRPMPMETLLRFMTTGALPSRR